MKQMNKRGIKVAEALETKERKRSYLELAKEDG